MISVLFPTTGRAVRAASCVQGLIDTTAGHDIELVAAVDDDHDTVAGLMALDFRHVKVQVDYSDRLRGNSQAWNDALRCARGDPIVFAADDLVWQPGWLDAALATLQEFPDGWGLVGFNDGHWGEELSTHYLMSRRFVVEVLGGRVAWPEYGHSFNDLETNERARHAGRYAWCEQARVVHEHWLFGSRDQDATDTRTLGDHAQAEATFQARKAQGFPDTNDPVIE